MLDLIKALLWPCIALISLILFGQPIQKILEAVPDILSQAESIDYGNFKISVKKSSLPKPTKDVSEAIGRMNRDALELVLQTGPNVTHCDPQNDPNRKNSFSALVEIGLAEHVSLPGGGCTGIRLNKLGKEVRQFFVTLTRAQFQTDKNAADETDRNAPE